MTTIHYLNSENIERKIEVLRPVAGQQNIGLMPFQIGQICEILFIFSPIKVNNTYIDAAEIWKKYLAQEQPECKLITIGFANAQHSNYIDLLNIPENLNVFFEQSKTAKENWIPIPVEGMDMQEKLRRFYEGHGKESVMTVFWAIIGFLNAIKTSLNRGIPYQKILGLALDTKPLFEGMAETDIPNIVTRWQTFQNRWRNYLPLFEMLPFYNEFQKINSQIEKIHSFFDSGCKDESFFNSDYYHDLIAIQKELEKIEKSYVK